MGLGVGCAVSCATCAGALQMLPTVGTVLRDSAGKRASGFLEVQVDRARGAGASAGADKALEAGSVVHAGAGLRGASFTWGMTSATVLVLQMAAAGKAGAGGGSTDAKSSCLVVSIISSSLVVALQNMPVVIYDVSQTKLTMLM